MIRLLLLLFLFSVGQSVAQPISWLTDCTEKNFCLNQGSCTVGAVYMVEKAVTNCGSPNISYSYKIDLNNDGSQDIQSSEDTVTGNFAKGHHKITWRASDNCGNVVQCTYLFHIKDCTPPNLLCINGLTQNLDPPDCQASFNANQFILNVSDNCIPANQIERGIRIVGTGTGFPSTQTLTFGICDNGLTAVEVWVRDENGLTNQCGNYVIIQSSAPACDCNADSDLQFSGCARSANNTRLSSYRVITSVKTIDATQPPISKVKTAIATDSCFSLMVNEIPFDHDYQAVIRADKPDAALNGVTTFDLVLISKHILGIEPLTSAYQLEAADVNNSNSITTFDIVETRKVILGIYDTFPLVPSWRFVRPLSNPSDLGSYTSMVDTYRVQLPNLHADLSFPGYTFVGIKYGDVNYSAGAVGPADDRADTEPLLLQTDNRWLKAGETAEISFRLGDISALDGWQVALSADPTVLQFLSVSGMPDSDYRLTDNELVAIAYEGNGLFTRRSALNAEIFTLKIKALQSILLSEALQLNTERLRPEAYQPVSNHQTIRRPVLFRVGAGNVKFYGVAPNPFTDQVDFNVQSDIPTTALLEIFTQDGRRVYAENFDLDGVYQSIRITSSSLPNEKIFLYRLFVAGEVFSGKMVRM